MKRERLRSIPTSKLTLPDADRDHIQGPIHAPFLLLEYGDYECLHCGEAYPIVTAVQKQLGNRLCFAFRNFPLTNIHRYAAHAAEAAEAAGDQGPPKFFINGARYDGEVEADRLITMLVNSD